MTNNDDPTVYEMDPCKLTGHVILKDLEEFEEVEYRLGKRGRKYGKSCLICGEKV